MHPLLQAALAEAAPLVAERGWPRPSEATLAEAERLLALVAAHRAPVVQLEADGRVGLEWEAADHGWLSLAVDGSGRLVHEAVIGGDDFAQAEDFGDALPAWAGELLARLMAAGH